MKKIYISILSLLLSAVFLITPICSFAEGEDIKTDISVSVKATGFNQVGVYWNIQNAPNAKYYTVFKSTSENSGFADVSGFIVNKSFTVKKLTYNKNYYFIVKAYDENKNLIISSVAVCGNTKSVKVNKPEARLMNGDIWDMNYILSLIKMKLQTLKVNILGNIVSLVIISGISLKLLVI